jgi:outer membrane protein assembly factor BamB
LLVHLFIRQEIRLKNSAPLTIDQTLSALNSKVILKVEIMTSTRKLWAPNSKRPFAPAPSFSSHLGLAFIILLAGCFKVISQTSFHANASHTGTYDSPELRELHGVKWKFKTEGAIISSPAISGGTVFIGSADNYLYAVDQQTGQQKWKSKVNGPVMSSPAIANGIVYFMSFDGIFSALAVDTGVVKWRFLPEDSEKRFEAQGLHGTKPESQTIPDPWDLFLSSPAVANGKVFFGSGDKNVYALDAQTGVLQWKFTTQDVVHSSPAVANNTVYIGGFDGYLYALDADTGQEKWKFKGGEDPYLHNQVGFQSSPAIAEGIVYIGCRDAHVYAIDANSGRKRWDYYTRKSWVPTTPAVRDGSVYVGTSDTRLVQALDAKTGRLRFTFKARAAIFSSIALAGGLAYVGDFTGRLYALDSQFGKVLWEFQTDSSKQDSLKVLNPDGTFNQAAFAPFYYDFEDMYLNMYRRFSVGSILSSPVVDHREIYFGSTDGFLYALN